MEPPAHFPSLCKKALRIALALHKKQPDEEPARRRSPPLQTLLLLLTSYLAYTVNDNSQICIDVHHVTIRNTSAFRVIRQNESIRHQLEMNYNWSLSARVLMMDSPEAAYQHLAVSEPLFQIGWCEGMAVCVCVYSDSVSSA